MMLPAFDALDGADHNLLILCDHAANAVPPGLRLGVDDALMDTHVAIDIGAGPLARALSRLLNAPAQLGKWSRLVADVNRPPDSSALAPDSSDGIAIPANQGLTGEALEARRAIHRDFHANVEQQLAARRPLLLVSVHSFTPALESAPQPRPWPVAILWNRDERAARIGLGYLEAQADPGGPVGANEPYTGKMLNYTMDRHAEANGIAYLGFEVRQDLLADGTGVARWAGLLAGCIRHVMAELAVTA